MVIIDVFVMCTLHFMTAAAVCGCYVLTVQLVCLLLLSLFAAERRKPLLATCPRTVRMRVTRLLRPTVVLEVAHTVCMASLITTSTAVVAPVQSLMTDPSPFAAACRCEAIFERFWRASAALVPLFPTLFCELMATKGCQLQREG
jgi:hypothetical protein